MIVVWFSGSMERLSRHFPHVAGKLKMSSLSLVREVTCESTQAALRSDSLTVSRKHLLA